LREKEEFLGINTNSFQEHGEFAVTLFDEGHEIEGFVVLHGLIEVQLNLYWIVFKACQQKRKGFDNEYTMSRSYNDLVSIMSELSLLEKLTIQELKQFNSFRNKLSHNLYGNKKERISKKTVIDVFEKGERASNMILPLMMKYLYQESKDNSLANKIAQDLNIRPKKLKKKGKKSL